MYQIPIDNGIGFVPNVIDDNRSAELANEIERLLEGKMINGQRRNHRYGTKVFGHFGPFEREPLPPTLHALLTDLYDKHPEIFMGENMQQYNQVEILKLSSGTQYNFDVDLEQQTNGPQLFININGQFPITLYNNTYGETIQTQITDDNFVQPANSIALPPEAIVDNTVKITAKTQSLILSPPDHGLLSIPSTFSQDYTRQIKATQSYRCKPIKTIATKINPTNNDSTEDNNLVLPSMCYDSTVLDRSLKLKNDEKKAKKLEYLAQQLANGKITQQDYDKQVQSEKGTTSSSTTTTDKTNENNNNNDLPLDSTTQQYLMSLPTFSYKRGAISYAIIFRQFLKHTPLAIAAAAAQGENVEENGISSSSTTTTTTTSNDNTIAARQKKQLLEKQQRQNKVVPTIAADLEQMTDEQLALFEKQHVHAVYDNIADHFSGTRYQAWPQVDEYIQSLPPQTFMADIGCGNGKYLVTNPHILTTGCDISFNLLQLAHDRGCEVAHGDGLAVPLRSNFYDTTISIAVLHHIASKKRRINAINEMLRITKVGGQVLITVWAKEQDGSGGRVFTQGDVWVPFKTSANVQQELEKQKALRAKEKEEQLKLRRKVVLTEGDEQKQQNNNTNNNNNPEDLVVEDKENNKEEEKQNKEEEKQNKEEEKQVILDIPIPEEINTDSTRFYHVFCNGELEEHVTNEAIQYPVRIDKVFYGKGNWCIIFTRLE